MITTKDYVFFYGAQDVYSNFYYHPFLYRGIQVNYSEIAFMLEKAIEFEDIEVIESLISAKNPKQAKALGRRVKNYNDTRWNLVRFDRMKQVLREKFKDPQLATRLVATGKRVLVEASPYDSTWGIGIGMSRLATSDINNWGQNLLGRALMDIREELAK